MSPEAIQSLIEMFGVERGVQILNLFTVPTEEARIEPFHRPELIRSRRHTHARRSVSTTVSV